MKRLLFPLGVASVLIAGCAVGPDFSTPHAPAAQRYTAADEGQVGAGDAAPRFPAGPPPAQWWTRFHSETLNAWVEEGLAANPDLQSSAAALIAAREQLSAQVGSTRFPQVDGAMQVSRQRALGIPSFGPPTVLYQLYAGVVQVNYDLDIFGGLRRENEALTADVDARAQELVAARQTLAANIVVTAIQCAALARQVQVEEAAIDLARRRAEMLQHRYEAGAVSLREALDAERVYDESASVLPSLRAQRDRDRHALAILLGRAPQDAPHEVDFDTLVPPDEIPVQVPSELVRTRPDVLAAEARLHSATANVGVATANLLPHLTLTAQYGSESFHGSSFLQSSSGVWGVGAGLLQPLFHGGALLAEKRAASAQVDAAYRRYEATVLKAFGDVGDSLRTVEEDSVRLSHTEQAERVALRIADDARQRRATGSETAPGVLLVEQQVQQETLARVSAQSAQLIDTANLFQAIGAPVP
jgi:NodT family efflux transporter outer membrane factor (OMF) lipoprotein